MRVGALFAGMGGLELGISAAFGAHPAWVCEVDVAASRILAHHWPGVPNLGDVTIVDWSQVEPVDIIAGGSPCLDLSTAGKRAGMRPGTRSGLWASMVDAIETIRPSLVIWENVRGALSASASSASDLVTGPGPMGDRNSGHLRALGRVLGDLANIGYDAAWCGLRAADVGAPHGRFRVFVLAWPSGDADIESGIERRIAAAGETQGGGHGPTLADQLEHLDANADSFGRERSGSARGRRTGPADSYFTTDRLTLLPTPTVVDFKASGGNPDTTGTHGTTLTDATVRQSANFGRYTPAIARWEALTRPAPLPTESTGRDGAQRLSPRFCEWMMGLPSGWVTDVPGVARNNQLTALGNGVVPQQAAAAIRHLLDVRATALRTAGGLR